jgi:hypothetical protein
MPRRAFPLFCATTALLIACGSSSRGGSTPSTDAGASDASDSGDLDSPAAPVCTSDAGAPSATEFAGQGDCPKATCTLTGTFDGSPIQQTYARGSQFSFVNGGTFDVDFGTGGKIHLDFSGAIASGEVANATARITMPSEGPRAGQTLCASSGTRIQQVGTPDEVRFILRCAEQPCLFGTVIPGELYGCCAP